MLPHVMRYNEDATAGKQQLISEALGKPGLRGADAVAELILQLEQPATLRAVGVKREQIPFIADAALKNRWVLSNPRPFSREEMIGLLEAAYG
jgi:alcohol dehydrogenase class IV